LLVLDGIAAGYRGLRILQDVSVEVGEGEVVALIGANGAGKTTALRTISGLLRPMAGTITVDGEPVTRLGPHEVVRRGLVHVPEGRELFGELTVRENLEMGAYAHGRAKRELSLREVHDMFPVLAERGRQTAHTLSGGQQQMLAIARALMARPRLLMLDEPSLGLAPKLVAEMFGTLERIRQTGITVLIVEQNVVQTLKLADRAYVLESGSIAAQGSSDKLLDDPRVRAAYLGR
jgi:branched-chain amino acid transport system ATP-binding protein